MIPPGAAFEQLYNSTNPGILCLSHRSVYCEHVMEVVALRADEPGLAEALGTNGVDSVMNLAVPIYPKYCVWEVVDYVLEKHPMLGVIGKAAVLDPPRTFLEPIQRLMPGDSANDLGMVLRQNFEDEAEETLGNIQADSQKRGSNYRIPWQCKSPRHSVKYQATVRAILHHDAIAHALVKQELDLQYAVMYPLIRHSKCLFCWINDERRDAVRVNPIMSALFPDAKPEDENYDDLVPF